MPSADCWRQAQPLNSQLVRPSSTGTWPTLQRSHDDDSADYDTSYSANSPDNLNYRNNSLFTSSYSSSASSRSDSGSDVSSQDDDYQEEEQKETYAIISPGVVCLSFLDEDDSTNGTGYGNLNLHQRQLDPGNTLCQRQHQHQHHQHHQHNQHNKHQHDGDERWYIGQRVFVRDDHEDSEWKLGTITQISPNVEACPDGWDDSYEWQHLKLL